VGNVAFFDVDGTLWSERSLVSFYESLIEHQYGDSRAAKLARFAREVAVKTGEGAAREALNAWFYEHYFRDLDVQLVAEVGRRWFETRVSRPGFFVEAAVRLAREHVDAGDVVVLVSGSFREIVSPLAEVVGASHLLVAPLEERAGVYTGRLTGAPMIGAGKADAVGAFLLARSIDPRRCYGYGDDDSDVPFLAFLGSPTVVSPGRSPMAAVARARGWSVLNVPAVGS
jgi:HAD superfamily hydrolase (TIGR01490 family)